MLEIRLFGSPEVTVDSSHVEVDTRKAIAMLAYLAIEHSADREALAALFWADSSPERARASLRRIPFLLCVAAWEPMSSEPIAIEWNW